MVGIDREISLMDGIEYEISLMAGIEREISLMEGIDFEISLMDGIDRQIDQKWWIERKIILQCLSLIPHPTKPEHSDAFFEKRLPLVHASVFQKNGKFPASCVAQNTPPCGSLFPHFKFERAIIPRANICMHTNIYITYIL